MGLNFNRSKSLFQISYNFKNYKEILILNNEYKINMKIIKINNFDEIKLFSFALWLYEFNFQIVSGYSTFI